MSGSVKLFKSMVVCLFLAVATVQAQGPLTPPGAPGPVMKTLSQVEPRTAITNLPLTINQPGSYYLTQNFSVTSGGSGIFVTTNNVTLDLMGFTISGNGTSGTGIFIGGGNFPVKNVVVMNGTIQKWQFGVSLHNTKGSRLENLIVEEINSYAIDMWTTGTAGSACLDNIIANCVVRNNASFGISLEAALGLPLSGNIIRQNTVSGNNLGIRLDALGGSVIDNRIVDNTVVKNFGDGISFSASSGGANTRNLVEGNFLSGNSSRGIAVAAAATNNIIVRNTAIGNSSGNYVLHANLVSGPLVTTAGALATTNGAPALSPWANFSR